MKFWHSLFLICILALLSCKTVPNSKSQNNTQNQQIENQSQQKKLTLLFAGDIMAHRPNYSMQDYSSIWEDIKPLVSSCDFSFANIESPVDDTLPFSPYPHFNMKSTYPEAAIDAGFNVFSLVNNHSNDQGLSGIKNTLKWADAVEEKTKDKERQVFFAGLKKSSDEEIGYKIINKNGWTIIFCAITEILNERTYVDYMNYVRPTDNERNLFKERIKKIKKENACDLFILSVHCSMPEYVRNVPESFRKYYYELLDCGVDIVWANHPHVVLEREFVGKKTDAYFSKLILYANGNTISAQRHEPQFLSPETERDFTGDGLLYKLTLSKKNENSTPKIVQSEAHYITTYITTAWTFIVKFLDDNFIRYLKKHGRNDWASYIKMRKKFMEKTPIKKTLRD